MKRLFDLTVTCMGLLCIWPLLIVVALLIRIKLGSPIFFRQQRPGLHGKPFTMIKFRTMTDKRDTEGNLLPDAGVPVSPGDPLMFADALIRLKEHPEERKRMGGNARRLAEGEF